VITFSAERVANAGANEYRVRQINGVVQVDVFLGSSFLITPG
jgi:hypothetical protein